MRRFLPIVLMLLLTGAAVSAQDTRRQESRKAQLEKEIAAINRQLKDNAKSSSRALTDLSLVRRKIAARQELIAESDREIHALDDSMKVRQREIDRLQARHDTLSLYYNRLVRGAYKNRDSRLWYMYILSSENIGQAVRRFGYLKGLSRNMSEQGKRIQETAAALELEKERLAGLRDEAQALRRQRQADVDALRGEEGESASLVARLEKDRKKYQNDLKKKKFADNYITVRTKLVEIEEKDRIRNFQPPISGEDIMEMFGLQPSKEVGLLKAAIKDAILDGKIPNEYEPAEKLLIEEAKKLGLNMVTN